MCDGSPILLSRSHASSVLKSTGSAFENFVRDEHTTLVEVNDRILSTSVDLSYVYPDITIDPQGLAGLESAMEFEKVFKTAKEVTLELFATDESASVQVRSSFISISSCYMAFAYFQATLFIMAQRIIADNKSVQSVSYRLPNKHYIPVNLAHVGLENMKP